MIYKLKEYLIANYKDDSGFLGLTKNPMPSYGEANSTLYTAQAYILFSKLGVLDFTDVSRFKKNIDDVTVLREGKPCKGLFHRHPTMENVLEAHDNYIGILTFASMVGLKDICEDVWQWGQTHKIFIPKDFIDTIKDTWFKKILSRIKCYWYNNLDPDLLRIESLKQGSVTAYIDYCADKDPGFVNKIWLVGSIIWSMFDKGTSTKILSWLMLEVLKEKHWFWKFVKGIFGSFVDIKKVTKEYFGDLPYSELYSALED